LLLRVLGDLEEVRADAALQDVLLKLPLAAMEVLLGCDELQVGSQHGNDIQWSPLKFGT